MSARRSPLGRPQLEDEDRDQDRDDAVGEGVHPLGTHGASLSSPAPAPDYDGRVERYDVAVIGAGPGGLGHRHPPRPRRRARAARRQGDVPARQALRRRSDPTGGAPAPGRPVRRSSSTRSTGWPSGSAGARASSVAGRRGPFVLMTQRRRLDQYLAEQAVAAGAEFRDGVKVLVGSDPDRGLTLQVDGQRAPAGGDRRRRRRQRHDCPRARPRRADHARRRLRGQRTPSTSASAAWR